MFKRLSGLIADCLAVAAIFLLGPCIAVNSAHARGAVREFETIRRLERAAIDAANHDIKLTGAAQCDVRIVQLTYDSVGVNNEPATLSAGLYVPENCRGPFPILAEAHGTETDRRRLTTEVGAASGTVAFFAGQGYLVVATDYLGLGKSDYPYHPYLHADSEASAIIDSIRAARQAATRLQIPLSGDVMLSGYSQGGHAAMAAQREIERHHRAELHLAASAPMAGPYYLSQTFMSSWFGQISGAENTLASELLAYTLINYNHIYHNVYADPREIFSPVYAQAAVHLFPASEGLFEIRERHVLPRGSQINALRNPAFTAAFLLDAHQPFRRDLERNDLLDWTPATPMILCGSRRDGIVDFNNAYAAQAAFRAQGVEVPVIDVADRIPSSATPEEHHTLYAASPCYAEAKTRLFDPAKAANELKLSRLQSSTR